MIKRTILFTSIFAVVFIIMQTSCAKTSREDSSCDSTNVSYSATIKTIIDNKCNSCHSTTNAPTLGDGIILDNYADVTSYIDTTTGGTGGRLLRDVVTGTMPKGQTKLDDCSIAKIRNWIKEGGKNN